ncbi:MAG: FecR domain-containing protein [Gammaproteobacteria bacterium]
MNKTTKERLDEEAVDWILRLGEGELSDLEFLDWIQRSPAHARAYLDNFSFVQKLNGFDPHKRIDVEPLIGSRFGNVIYEVFSRTREVSRSLSSARPVRRVARTWTRVAVIALVAFGVWLAAGRDLWSPSVFRTGTGEQREVKLEDNTIIQLNTRSQIEVEYSAEVRKVHLISGEALFTVAHDARRPFRVDDGRSTFQAIGTAFNLRKSGNGKTTLTVTEGTVEIAANQAQVVSLPAKGLGLSDRSTTNANSLPRAAAGEQVVIGDAGHVVKEKVSDVERSLAWRKRELPFSGTPLVDVAAEFNRYNDVQLRVEGAVGAKKISGLFSADHPQSLVLYLKQDRSVEVIEQGDRVVIRSR